MSDFVRSLQPSFVSYEALEVACHAVESYCDRLKDSAVEKLKVSTLFYDLMCSPLYRWILCLAVSEQIHCYRATLETLLVRLDPPIRRAGLRSVKNAHLMTFEQYAQKGKQIVSLFKGLFFQLSNYLKLWNVWILTWIRARSPSLTRKRSARAWPNGSGSSPSTLSVSCLPP